MTWIEWLIWRWDRWRLQRPCRRGEHDITGPHKTAGGWQVFTCTRCTYRFRPERVITS